MSLPSGEAVGLQRVQRADAVWGSKAVHSDFKGMERLRLGVVPVRPSPRVAEKSGRRPSRAHPPQNRRRSESLRSRQASPLDPDAGFTVQCINADHAVNNGDRIFGYKLATSPQAGGLAVGRAVAHPVFRRSRRRWCCAGGHGVQPIVWCGICPPVIRHQSQNYWLNDRLLDPSHAGAPVIWECRAPEGQARACEPTSLSSVARLGDCAYGLELCSKEYA